MRYFEYCLHAKLKDAYALQCLGRPNMLHYIYKRFFNEASDFSVQTHHVLGEISSILTVKSDRDEFYRGSLNINSYQLNRALAESYAGFADRLDMFGLTRKQAFECLLQQDRTCDLMNEINKCRVLADCSRSTPS